MIRLLLKGGVLLLITHLVCVGMNAGLISKYWGDQKLRNKMVYGEDFVHYANTLFIGSSNMKYGIHARDFDDFNGRGYSYNLSEGNLLFPESYFLADDFLDGKTHFPNLETIYLELSNYKLQEDKFNNTTRMRYFFNGRNALFARQTYNRSNLSQEEKWTYSIDILKKYIENLFRVSMINTSLTNVFQNRVTKDYFLEKKIGYTNYYDRNAVLKWQRNSRVRKHRWKNRTRKTSDECNADKGLETQEEKKLVDYLQDLNRKATAQDVNLVLVLMPRLKLEYLQEVKPVFDAYSGTKISFCSPKEYPELWDHCDNAFDHAHLNLVGANFLSEHLSRFHVAQGYNQ